jgi:hypothetical protein
VAEYFPKWRVSLAKQEDKGTQFPRKTLVVWFFGGFAAKKPHHQSYFRVSGKISVTPASKCQ